MPQGQALFVFLLAAWMSVSNPLAFGVTAPLGARVRTGCASRLCPRRSSLRVAMVLERSNVSDFPVGTVAPAFVLPEPLTEEMRSFEDLRGSAGTLVAFICVHCPFVKHLLGLLPTLALRLQDMGINMVGISANDARMYPEDSPKSIAKLAETTLKTFPLLYDETQATALAYKAKCTPDFYLFGADMRLVYRGRLDESTPGNAVEPTGAEMIAAAERLVRGEPIDVKAIRPSMGCSIKWKPGNEPR